MSTEHAPADGPAVGAGAPRDVAVVGAGMVGLATAWFLQEAGAQVTPTSPVRSLTPFQMTRYLDYCSEMLSLSAKVAALYAQSFPDPVVTDAVSDLERVTTNLSQKIWQKISMIQTHWTGPLVRAEEEVR